MVIPPLQEPTGPQTGLLDVHSDMLISIIEMASPGRFLNFTQGSKTSQKLVIGETDFQMRLEALSVRRLVHQSVGPLVCNHFF